MTLFGLFRAPEDLYVLSCEMKKKEKCHLMSNFTLKQNFLLHRMLNLENKDKKCDTMAIPHLLHPLKSKSLFSSLRPISNPNFILNEISKADLYGLFSTEIV